VEEEAGEAGAPQGHANVGHQRPVVWLFVGWFVICCECCLFVCGFVVWLFVGWFVVV
jgi:hypothetical protein